LRLTLEHQQTLVRSSSEKYFTDVIVAEYLQSPGLSVSIVVEMQTKEPEKDRIVRRLWGFLQLGYNFWDNTDVSLLFGTRQAGNICIGGVCRYEPEFRGVELKMTTRLF